MADVAPYNEDEGEEEEQGRRRREHEIEELFLRQVELEDDHQHHRDEGEQAAPEPELETPARPLRISYTQASFGAALGVLWYALRTRQQWYLALVFISSSKCAYIVLGNALIALCISLFRFFTNIFLGGLRLVESEGLGDFFRWNVTETCLALTMFRSEISVQTCILFLFLVLVKCLHWVVELREGHLRMTQEAVVAVQRGAFMQGFPTLTKSTFGIWAFLQVLFVLDVAGVAFCAHHIYLEGPSVYLLFGFEAAILFVTSVSLSSLWYLHVLDGFLHYLHDETRINVSRMLHIWKDRKATIIFAIEVQAQGAKFLAYIAFFAVVLTYYGIPINLFREVYMSFQSLKNRLIAFAKYNQLMTSMNRFESIDSDDELDKVGRTCIICRDDMTLGDSKKLPGCGHAFHKSCLREWLVQQQTCPTCRGDISVMEGRARQERQQQAAAEAARANSERQRQDEGTAESIHAVVPSPTNDSPPLPNNLVYPEHPASVHDPIFADHFAPNSQIEHLTFPALYQVSSATGAQVVRDDGSICRIISFNKGVLVIGSKWQVVSLADNSTHRRLFLQVPDGWIPESEVKSLLRIPA